VQDADAIAVVQVAAWREAYRGLMPDAVLENLDVASRASTWREILANEDSTCFVAQLQDRVIGFVHVCPCRNVDKEPCSTGEIAAAYCDPSHWRQGWGTALLREALGNLKQQGFCEVTLWVLEENRPGRAFYEKHGFEFEGAKKILAGLDLVELRYAKYCD
jgi:ribosomal protein S18 acetylase RimI-like enzyme